MPTDPNPVWTVIAKIDPIRNNGSLFEEDAKGLTEVEAEAEAQRRNIAERREGHVGIDWVPAKDRIEALKQAGYDVSKVRGRS